MDSHHTLRTFYDIGATSPLHATATGRAILAHLPRVEVDELIAGGLEKFSESTPTEPAELHAALDRVRADGHSANLSQYRPDVCAVAAPILDEGGTPLASVGVSMSASRYDEARLPELGQLVADTAKEITALRLGA